MIKRNVSLVVLAIASLLAVESTAVGADRVRHHSKRIRVASEQIDGRAYENYQWYVGEYPYPYVTVSEPIYSRCRTGWWSSSYLGHPRPQWATYCQQ